MAIMQAESGCISNQNNAGLNSNGSVDYGLFQVNSVHRNLVNSLNDLYDPATNISVAYQIYRGGGWKAWSTYNNGAYLKYL